MKYYQILALSLGAVITVGALSACGTSAPTSRKSSPSATTSSTSTPVPTAASKSSMLILPVATNPIVNNSTAPGLVITYSAAENNVDPATHNPIADRLEITINNTSTKLLVGLEVYYEMTDVVTKAKEGYYQRLSGVSITPKKRFTIYFDGIKRAGHYPENQFSLYRNSQNQVNFKIWVSASGVKIAQATALKSIGSSEIPNS